MATGSRLPKQILLPVLRIPTYNQDIIETSAGNERKWQHCNPGYFLVLFNCFSYYVISIGVKSCQKKSLRYYFSFKQPFSSPLRPLSLCATTFM